MESAKRVSSEPVAYNMKGFTLDELVSPKLLSELKAVFPTAVIGAMAVGFTDSKDQIYIGHERKEGKYLPEIVEIHGDTPDQTAKTVQAVTKAVGK